MMRPPDNLKVICERLAYAWKVEGHASSLRSVDVLLKSCFSDEARTLSWHKPNEIQKIGTWVASGIGKNRRFTRTGSDPEKYWAETESVFCFHEKKRVVLLGESLARGYYYEPEFTPASAIQQVLRQVTDGIEVIDLSKIALGLWELLEMVSSCRALHPDAVVIMAGNNWHPVLNGMWTNQNSRALATILRKEFTNAAAASYLLDVMATATERFLEEVGKLAQCYGIPVLCVIPEANLSDWRIPEKIPPLLNHADLKEWIGGREHGRRALQAGNSADAASRAYRLLQVDQGSHPSGFYLLADAKANTGEVKGIEKLLRQARDCNLTVPTDRHCYTRIAEIIRQNAATIGLHVLDLPVLMSAHLGGDVPDRRMFMDYCHLSANGIGFTASEVAKQLVSMLGEEDGTNVCVSSLPFPPSKTVAKAHLLASLVAARLSQGESLIAYHLSQALDADPKAGTAICSLLEWKLRQVPVTLCPNVFRTFSELEDLSTRGVVGLYSNSTAATRIVQYSSERSVDSLEIPFIRALTRSLTIVDHSNGLSVPERICGCHSIKESGRDLLESVYIESSIVEERRWMDLGSSGFFRAFGNKSDFIMLVEEATLMEVTLSCRCRDTDCVGSEGSVLCNGEEITRCVVGKQWSTSRFLIPTNKMRRGLNVLTIEWPVPSSSQIALHRERQVDALELGKIVQPALVFGEIYELLVRRVSTDSPSRTAEQALVGSGH